MENQQNIDLSKLDLNALKALVYDLSKQNQNIANSIQVVNSEIEKRTNPPSPTPGLADIEEAKVTEEK